MTEHKVGEPIDCPKCHKGYKYGFFERCPHCNVETGTKFPDPKLARKPKKKKGRRR